MPAFSSPTNSSLVPQLSVGVVAPDEIGKRRIVSVLSRDGLGLEVVLLNSDIDSLLRSCDEAPDAVVAFADKAGLVRRIRRSIRDVALVAITPAGDRHQLRAALTEGADGVVPDSHLDGCLGITVRAAFLGQIVVPQDLRAALVKPALSVREKQILGLVVLGLTNGEIAGKLFVTESTVKSHLSSAFGKLGVRSRGEATSLILDPEKGLGLGILAIAGGEARIGRLSFESDARPAPK
jgi:DNA-binding NarL/FixJ family response regulator